LVQSGTIAQGSRVLFAHTGGLAALFAYRPEIEAALPPR
jgi:1-aminocyclopropane-1-carboxylate deaminase/D-cysteine desulfhydrase-like pyridoxal-dependent ACC family enzyme